MVTLAIDPGKRIGWAMFGPKGEIGRGVTDWDGLMRDLDELDYWMGGVPTFRDQVINEVVVENYRVDPGTPQGGREVVASEVIGALRLWCDHHGIPFTRQEPSILSVAMKHTGYVKTRQHLPDEDSAYLHGYYYEESKGRLAPLPLGD
jgi:hypothetical protein